MGRLTLRYVETFRDRHGKPRAYFRFRGERTPLPGPDTPEFAAAYAKQLQRIGAATATEKGGKHTLSWLIAEYRSSPEFKRLAERTRKDYDAILYSINEEHGSKP